MNHKHVTLNYDEAAAMDDGPPSDGPTLDTHALPGDEELWKSFGAQGALGLPRASASESEGALPTATALRIAKETPFPPHVPMRNVPIVFEGSPKPPAAVDAPAEAKPPREATTVPAPPGTPTVPPSSDTAKRRVALLVSLAIAAVLVGAALTRIAHDAQRDRARAVPAGVSPTPDPGPP